ncbi:MAG: IS66 family insertion sequence element accessory protein TnpA [Lachnospiraceae bacterium]
MTATRKARVPMAEQIRLINECRQSGMTDADWCRENDIAVSTFYNWVSRCRKAAADQIPAPNCLNDCIFGSIKENECKIQNTGNVVF